MKNIIIILVILSGIYSCIGSKYIHEDTLYVTRKYCGEFDKAYVVDKCTKIVTTQDYVLINGIINLNIPDSAKCYLRYIPETIGLNKYWVLYFTYDGTEDLIMIKPNYITGKVY